MLILSHSSTVILNIVLESYQLLLLTLQKKIKCQLSQYTKSFNNLISEYTWKRSPLFHQNRLLTIFIRMIIIYSVWWIAWSWDIFLENRTNSNMPQWFTLSIWQNLLYHIQVFSSSWYKPNYGNLIIFLQYGIIPMSLNSTWIETIDRCRRAYWRSARVNLTFALRCYN